MTNEKQEKAEKMDIESLIPDVIILMRRGFSHDKIKFGMTVNDLKEQIGDPDSIIGNNDLGYYMYGPLRIGYFNDVVDSIVILFQELYDYQFHVNLNNLDRSDQVINKKMRMHDLIKIFNNNGVGWSAGYRKYDLDYVTIYVESGSEVVFELENGYIWWIAFSPSNVS